MTWQHNYLSCSHQSSHCLAQNKFQDFPGPCCSPQQRVNIFQKQQLLTLHYNSTTVASILQCSSLSHVVKKNVLSLQERITKTRGVRTSIILHPRPHHCVPIPANSRTFQDAWKLCHTWSTAFQAFAFTICKPFSHILGLTTVGNISNGKKWCANCSKSVNVNELQTWHENPSLLTQRGKTRLYC